MNCKKKNKHATTFLLKTTKSSNSNMLAVVLNQSQVYSCTLQPYASVVEVREVKKKGQDKRHASCQTCDERACVMRCLLTLARTLSLCWVRAMALVGPAV